MSEPFNFKPTTERCPGPIVRRNGGPRDRGSLESFRSNVALFEARSPEAEEIGGARHSNGKIYVPYLLDPSKPLSELSFNNLEDLEEVVGDGEPADPLEETGPYWVYVLHDDTSAKDEKMPDGYKWFGNYEEYHGPIYDLQTANRASVALMHERHRELYTAYYQHTMVDATYDESIEDDKFHKMMAVHDRFFLVVQVVDQIKDDTDPVFPYEHTFFQYMVFHVVTLRAWGPVVNKVIPKDDPEDKTEIILSPNNANKCAAAMFLKAAKPLLPTQDIQKCMLGILKQVERAEVEAEERCEFSWFYQHTFQSRHKLPLGAGWNIKTRLRISVRAVEVQK